MADPRRLSRLPLPRRNAAPVSRDFKQGRSDRKHEVNLGGDMECRREILRTPFTFGSSFQNLHCSVFQSIQRPKAEQPVPLVS